MNKDVVYIEPEEDITDIISRLKSSKQKVVALVPPKKAGILRSSVNAKLITKAAKQSDKAVVIISSDPSVIKVVSLAGLPVAKTLQSRPVMPEEIIKKAKEKAAARTEELAAEDEAEDEADDEEVGGYSRPAAKTVHETAKVSGTRKALRDFESGDPVSDEDIDINSAELEDDEKKAEKKKKRKNKNDVNVPTIEKYRIPIIAGIVAVILLIGFAIWANVFAPAARISVAVSTEDNNFAENVNFTTNQNQVDIEGGTFLLENVSYNDKHETEFEATGERNDGEKAKGTVTISHNFGASEGSVVIKSGTIFNLGNSNYTADAEATLSWDGESDSQCDGGVKGVAANSGCVVSATINVTAVAGGTASNADADSQGWSVTDPDFKVTSNSAITGGTDKIVKVVTADDIKKAAESAENNTDSDAKQKLLSQITADVVPIESSYKVSSADPTSDPAVDNVVEDGKKAKLSVTTTYSMYAIDKTAIETFIKKKTEATLASDQKVYDLGTPFFERFVADQNTAKLKTIYKTGSTVTEQEILEKSLGKKVGEVKSQLVSLRGVKDVNIETSFFFVRKIPNDSSKVQVELTVEK